MTGGEPGRGGYPVSYSLGWHGGIHLEAPSDGANRLNVRAIADGTVVYVRKPKPRVNPAPADHPLNYYRGWTSDGCVVIRHDTEIGADANNAPISDEDFLRLREHIEELAFWEDANIGISSNHWHFQPREFIRQFRKCGWLSGKEFKRVYPDSRYPVNALTREGRGRTPDSVRDTYRHEINRVIRKYLINTPIRMTHFFGQGAVE